MSDSPKLADALPPLTSGQMVLAAVASVFGWGLDLFDLLILLYVAPIIGRLFFPAGNPMVSLAATYASFAVTLLMRPLGSAIFGTYADRSGRRKAMIVAVVGVGVVTAIFGALPTVNAIGWAASLIFVFFRLVQGIFVGGVVASSHTIGTESVPERWRGLMSGAVGGGGSALGGLLASLVFYVMTLIAPGPALADWGWRLMFASGLLTTVIGLVLFRKLEESPIFAALQANKRAAREARLHAEPAQSPVAALLSSAHRPVFLVNLLLTLGAGAGYYLTSGYLPTFFNLVNKLPGHEASVILIGANLSAAVGALAFGELSQHVGRKPVFIVMGIIRVIAFPLLYLAMAKAAGATLAIYALLLAFIANGSYGHLLIFLNERFPTGLRATGTGLSWNVGFALGGMMPTFVSLASDSAQDLPVTLAVFAGVLSAIYLIGSIAVPETVGNLRSG